MLPAAATVFAGADKTASHRTYLSPVGRLLLSAVALVYGQTALMKMDPKQENGGAHYVIKPILKPPYKVSTSVLGLLSHKVRTVAGVFLPASSCTSVKSHVPPWHLLPCFASRCCHLDWNTGVMPLGALPPGGVVGTRAPAA